MTVGATAVMDRCLIKSTYLMSESGLIHERWVRLTHTYESDRSKEGIA